MKSTETEACANACEVLKHLSHDANQSIRKIRSPDERWKSSNNSLSTGALFLFFRLACCRASRSPNAQAPVVQASLEEESTIHNPVDNASMQVVMWSFPIHYQNNQSPLEWVLL